MWKQKFHLHKALKALTKCTVQNIQCVFERLVQGNPSEKETANEPESKRKGEKDRARAKARTREREIESEGERKLRIKKLLKSYEEQETITQTFAKKKETRRNVTKRENFQKERNSRTKNLKHSDFRVCECLKKRFFFRLYCVWFDAKQYWKTRPNKTIVSRQRKLNRKQCRENRILQRTKIKLTLDWK